MSALPPLPSPHVTPYDRLTGDAAVVEERLRRGAEDRELDAWFGESVHAELSALARRIPSGPPRAGERVYVLPGMMGSQLGLRRARPLPDDVVWFDPIDLGAGRILALRVLPGSQIVALGALLYDYMRLYLHLRVAGFDVVLQDYDWRLGVDVLGETFASALRADPATRITVVAHSLGGLVARAALARPGTACVRRLVMLGTPHRGSFAAVQAFRGTYPLVRRIASLDHTHSAEELATQVFRGFASLYHLLPARGPECPLDLFDAASWPLQGPRPDPALLVAARALPAALAPADERFSQIAGSGEETVTRLERAGEDFRYGANHDGDGTVPLAHAVLPGVPTRFVSGVRHGELQKDAAVIEAIVDLVGGGRTTRLAEAPPPPAPAANPDKLRFVTDTDLRRTLTAKIDWAALTPLERSLFLDRLSAPPDADPPC